MNNVLRVVGVLMVVAGLVFGVLALTTGGGDGSKPKPAGGEITYELRVKDKLISGVYKAYGMLDCIVPMWLAKTVFKNDTPGRITDLRIRYKLGEFADWSSWKKYPAVDPTQTVVDLYHPILSKKCAELTSRAPAELQVEIEYTDAAGEKRTLSDGKRIILLSRHEFIFSDLTAGERTAAFQDTDTLSPLLAAWVSRSDEPVARLASMANKKAGGVGASGSHENCIKVMRELYEIMRTIQITYQHPAVLADKTLSYDIKSVQSLQYPRDTIQKRSGTCIDLAILYAAMLNSVNIKPILVSMDGHCFPIGVSPNGNFIPVETTGVGGGGKNSVGFEKTVAFAENTLKKLFQNGRYTLIDVRQCWTSGVSNPELTPLPPDILEKWGIVKLVEGGGGPAPTPPVKKEKPRPPQPPPTVRLVPGNWQFVETLPNGTSSTGACQIGVNGNQVQMVATAAGQVMGQDGLAHQAQSRCTYVGVLTGSNLTATCNSASMTVDGSPMPVQGLPFRLVGTVSQNGRAIQGRISNAMGMTSQVALQAR